MLLKTRRSDGKGKRENGHGPRDRGAVAPGGGIELGWVDEFITRVRPYVFARREDGVLIKMPNEAFHLNTTGAAIMDSLLGGESIDDVMRRVGTEHAVEVGAFIHAVKRCLEGELRETDRSCAVEVKPLSVSFSRLPVLAEVALTDRCNLRCIFCYAGCSCGVTPGGDGQMSTEEVKTVIDRVYREARVPSVSFTGGEPTLRRDLPGLVEHAVAIGMRVNLITNGTQVTGRLARELAVARLASAQVSLEGASAAVHDKVTGVTGSFAATLAGLANLRDTGVHVHTNTTINRLNIETCTEIPGFVRELGLEKFSMNLIIPSGSAAADPSHLLRYRDIGPVLESVIDASDAAGVEFMWYSPTPLCIFNPVLKGLGNKGCSACDGLLSVDSSGDVLPCSSWDEPVGSLLHDGFEPVWSSVRAEACRRKEAAPPGCDACDNFAVCHGACPLYWDHFGYGELGLRGSEAEPVPVGQDRRRRCGREPYHDEMGVIVDVD